jgi:pimeloyl-ACP methyl ester carboxylesterase
MSTIIPATAVKTVAVDGIDVFYREAGDEKAPVILLLHGFPTSSFQYRNLIPRLALQYRVIVSSLQLGPTQQYLR